MSKKKLLKNIQKEESKRVTEEKDNYFRFITTLAILLVIFILSYFIIGLFYTKEIDLNNDSKDKKDEVSIDNNTIMIGQMFEQSSDDYYVLIYDTSDKESLIPTWKSVYEGKDNPLTIYTVDSKKKFNAKYITNSDSNKNATSLDDLKVVSPTLIRITNKQISDYIEGEDSIVNKFKEN